MKVLADFHHSDLYYSLHLLFEKRLKCELYRPIGMEWFHEGFWELAKPYGNAIDTVKQFLEIRNVPTDGTVPLNDVRHYNGGIHKVVSDYRPDYHQNAITLDAAKRMKFDLVIASVPYQISAFERFRKAHSPNAYLVHQMGNNWQKDIDFGVCRNLMASAMVFGIPSSVNTVIYHQEFRTDIFEYQPPCVAENQIASFMNCPRVYPGIKSFFEMKYKMPGYRFRMFGSQSDDGCLTPHEKIADEMGRSMFVWHVKQGGDGFGHIIHNAMSVGRPIITKISDYQNQLAHPMLEHRKTCVDLDVCSVDEAVKYITEISVERYTQMCVESAHAFKTHVNFNEEEKIIRSFLSRLKR